MGALLIRQNMVVVVGAYLLALANILTILMFPIVSLRLEILVVLTATDVAGATLLVQIYMRNKYQRRVSEYKLDREESRSRAMYDEIRSLRQEIETLRSFRTESAHEFDDLSAKAEAGKGSIPYQSAKQNTEHLRGIGIVQGSSDLLNVYRDISSEFSHSLKTPIASIDIAIKNILEKLPEVASNKESELTKTLLKLLDNASLSSEYAKQILDNRAGFFPKEAEILSMDVVIRRLQRHLQNSGLPVDKILADVSGLPRFKFYWLNLHLALSELLINAMEYTQFKEHVKIEGRLNKNNQMVEIDVSNTGQVSPEIKDKILNERVSTKGEDRGYGLMHARHCLEVVYGILEVVPHKTRVIFRISFRFMSEGSR